MSKISIFRRAINWLTKNILSVGIGLELIGFFVCLFLCGYYSYKKDFYNEVSWGICSVNALICALMLIQHRFTATVQKNILKAVLEGNKYERHVIKRLHDELIKKDNENPV